MKRICYIQLIDETAETVLAKDVLVVYPNPKSRSWIKVEIRVLEEHNEDDPPKKLVKLSLLEKMRKFL